MDTSNTREINSYIDPQTFVSRMEKHWTGELENVSSPALRKAWLQIADTFKRHILGHNKPQHQRRWDILSPPTGSGKTESTVIYCAMLADVEPLFHPGVLIVTRLIDDCNRIAERINQFGKTETAVAYHSEAEVQLGDLLDYPVVVITHRAYELALDFLGHEGEIKKTWPYFHNWMVDTRRLVVVDECLDIVEHSQTGLEGIRLTLAAIPQDVRERYTDEVMAVETIINVLTTIRSTAKDTAAQETMVLREPPRHGIAPDLTDLIKALDDIRFDYQNGKNDLNECRRLREIHKKRLKGLHYIFRSWNYYANSGKDHTLNTARLLVPEGVKGAVVMDATAKTNIVYDIHKDSYRRHAPKGVRSYRNFTLHVSRGHRVGKNAMVKSAKQGTSDLIQDLNRRLTGRKAFVVCHKGVEPVLQKWETTFEMKTGHWGAIDGSNEWRDCDTVVLYGLNYLPSTWTANVFMALQGPQDTEWLRSDGVRQFGDHRDIRKALERGQLSTGIIQAINRIRCRRVNDAQGNCPLSEGYLLLPAGSVADVIRDHIRQAMPDIVIKEDWEFKKHKRRAKASKHGLALVKYIENMMVGRVAVTGVARELGISVPTMKRLVATTKEAESDLSKALRKFGVRYEVVGRGRGARSFFVRD